MIDLDFIKTEALNCDELDRVVGGIIIVGGVPQLVRQSTSVLDRVSINPQPLPPRILSIGFGH